MAHTFPQVFGEIMPGDMDDMKKRLRRTFAALAHHMHPDKVSADLKPSATEAIQLLTRLRDDANKALENGTYNKPFTPLSVEITELVSAKKVYFVPDSPAWTGDYSGVYVATQKGDGAKVRIKIAKKPTFNGILEHEERVVRKLMENHVPFVDPVIDSFLIADGSKRLRATVYPFREEMLSLAEIRTRMDGPLDARDAAWIWRRVAGQVLAAKQGGFVHGAITPDHVLVHPVSHSARHIGWAQATKPNTCVMRPNLEWCAPEMLADEPVNIRCDIYMAGKTMLYLVEKRFLPDNIKAVLLWATDDDPSERPHSGRLFMDVLTSEIRKEWGRQYRQLRLP